MRAEECSPAPGFDTGHVRGIFSHISGVYDLLNHILSLGLDSGWREKLADALLPLPERGERRILDLAAGTMELSLVLSRRFPDYKIAALDFCKPMLRKGLSKLDGPGRHKVLPLTGDARSLPLPDACMSASTMAFGLRNISERAEVYAEVLRVLTPKGRFCILEFAGAKEPLLFGLYNFYLTRILPVAGGLVSGNYGAYRHLADSILSYPAADELAGEMGAAGFVNVRYKKIAAGIVCLHSGEKPG
ncbi:MAG: ubiquinone/menaquinone biosynthesis methyltransferase [Desulfovibrio sp.]|jgi:demethylmenaquinone methyltransferase/2-methoxy-6-polyprenyl-1,4-benzoquinol methylase|nr:ubiquinone/menaquinone biosynthesis methyltransferase [Desulfovibrio sp.]